MKTKKQELLDALDKNDFAPRELTQIATKLYEEGLKPNATGNTDLALAFAELTGNESRHYEDESQRLRFLEIITKEQVKMLVEQIQRGHDMLQQFHAIEKEILDFFDDMQIK